MKLTAPLSVAILAFGVNSAAVAAPPVAADPMPFCWRPGNACAKVKRAADALAAVFDEPAPTVDKRSAMAEAEAFCWGPIQPCVKAKRDALALASAVAEAMPDAHIYYDQLKVREAFPEPNVVTDGMFHASFLLLL